MQGCFIILQTCEVLCGQAQSNQSTVTSRQRRCNLGKLLLCEYGCGYFLPVLPSWNIQTLPVSSATNDSMSFLIRIWRDRRICFPSSLTCVQSGWLNCCGYSILCVEFSECDGMPFACKRMKPLWICSYLSFTRETHVSSNCGSSSVDVVKSFNITPEFLPEGAQWLETDGEVMRH